MAELIDVFDKTIKFVVYSRHFTEIETFFSFIVCVRCAWINRYASHFPVAGHLLYFISEFNRQVYFHPSVTYYVFFRFAITAMD